MKDLSITVGSATSEIHCGEGAFETFVKKLPGRQIYIITDTNVFALYRQLICEAFGDGCAVKVLPAGESSKTYRTLIAVLSDMLKCGMKRNCTVVAIGGGVVGDLAGLAASLFMRGTRLVHIPTTLLAQVDSSIGGKTAVDLDGVKNAIGTFYQPEEVVIDPMFLHTLPAREIRCGLGEVIKYCALNEKIFDFISGHKGNFEDFAFSEELIYLCAEHKASVVSSDERDLQGIRKTLNLGHTTGHAFELFYRKKSHGEFVLIGMFYELYIAVKTGICQKEYAEKLKTLILSVIKKAPRYDNIESAARFALFDKKNEDDKVSLIVPQSAGKSAEIRLSLTEYTDLLIECCEGI